jgi:hypothetical protein
MIKQKKKRSLIFPIVLLSYALLFLVATAFGMRYLWDFLDTYERSRPHITLDSYMENLSKDYVAERCGELINTIDHSVQTEQQCRDVIPCLRRQLKPLQRLCRREFQGLQEGRGS